MSEHLIARRSDPRRTAPFTISIQARMASARLPGKPLAIVAGRTLLEWQLARLDMLGDWGPPMSGWPVVVATTDAPEDDPIERTAIRCGAVVVRGFADDPPARHLAACRATGAEAIAFVGADQPLVRAEDFVTAYHALRDGADYVRVVGLPYGLHVWAVTRDALEQCVADPGRDADEREHTGAYWDRRPDVYRTVSIDVGLSAPYRLTVDTHRDLEVHRLLIEGLAPTRGARFGVEDMIGFLRAHPDIAAINANVAQYLWSGAPGSEVHA